jgi:hypothetical protein
MSTSPKKVKHCQRDSDSLINALGIRPHLPSPYSPEQLKRIELYGRAIKIMEPLYAFGQEVSTWTYEGPKE